VVVFWKKNMAAILIIYDYTTYFYQFSSQDSVVSMYNAHQLFNLIFGGKKLRAIH